MRSASKIRELGYKKVHDLRSYLALVKRTMAERMNQAASDVRASGKTMLTS